MSAHSTPASADENDIPADIVPPQAAEPKEGNPETTLQAEIERLNGELGKMREQWIRAVAETDNIRKRSARDLEDNARYAVTRFAGDMVSVLENLKRASDSIPEKERAGSDLLKKLGEGVDLTLNELLGIFRNHGIQRVDPQNAKFDHNLHQAVAQAERDDVPAGTVVQVVQAGYTIHDRLLQPAMVVVSKAADPSKKVDTVA